MRCSPPCGRRRWSCRGASGDEVTVLILADRAFPLRHALADSPALGAVGPLAVPVLLSQRIGRPHISHVFCGGAERPALRAVTGRLHSGCPAADAELLSRSMGPPQTSQAAARRTVVHVGPSCARVQVWLAPEASQAPREPFFVFTSLPLSACEPVRSGECPVSTFPKQSDAPTGWRWPTRPA